MNNFNKIYFSTLLLGLFFFFSCGNGKKNPPIISLSETEITVLSNELIEITVTYEKGDRKIRDLRITGIGDETVVKQREEENTFVYKQFVPDAGGTTITGVFTVTDIRGNESSAELILHIETPFEEEITNGILNNVQGPSSSAWDMVEHKSLTTIDQNSNKDLIDRTSGSTGEFLAGGWGASNATTFVVDSTYNYERASVESAKKAFEEGTEITLLRNSVLYEGSTIIAKLRGEETFAVIHVLDTYDDGKDGGTGGNSDYRRFKYKK